MKEEKDLASGVGKVCPLSWRWVPRKLSGNPRGWRGGGTRARLEPGVMGGRCDGWRGCGGGDTVDSSRFPPRPGVHDPDPRGGARSNTVLFVVLCIRTRSACTFMQLLMHERSRASTMECSHTSKSTVRLLVVFKGQRTGHFAIRESARATPSAGAPATWGEQDSRGLRLGAGKPAQHGAKHRPPLCAGPV